VRETAARVRSSVNVDTILRTAVRELGQTLGAAGGLIRLEVADDETQSQREGRELR
jgi:GAF domain-containing protein